MPIVVSIDYQNFLVSSKKDATTIITALAGAIKLDRVHRNHKTIFFPDDRQAEISIQTILPDQLVRSKPPEEDEPIQQPATRVLKQLGFDGGAQ